MNDKVIPNIEMLINEKDIMQQSEKSEVSLILIFSTEDQEYPR